MLFLFLTAARGADAMPILNQQCTTNQIFNATQYQCLACPATFVVVNGTCRPTAQNVYWIEGTDPTLAASYTAQCSSGFTPLNMTCYNTSVPIDQRVAAFETFLNTNAQIHYYNLQTAVNGARAEETRDLTAEYKKELVWAMFVNSVDRSNTTATAMISNACAVMNYDATSIPCAWYQANFTGLSGQTMYGYRFWPSNAVFLDYGLNSLSYVMSETFIESEFTKNRVMNFWLARFSKYGDFKGYLKLGLDFQKCGNSNEVMRKWQQYGSNYYSTCIVDFAKIVGSDTTDLFEPFIEDTTTASGTVIRPCPVFLKTYRGTAGSDVNRGNVASQYRAVRRFFLLDNYTSDPTTGIVQFLTNLSIVVEKSQEGNNRIYSPLFQVDVTQVRRQDIVPDPTAVRLTKETLTHRKYNFEVLYTQNLSAFWEGVTIVFSIVLALGLVYAVFRVVLHARMYGQDGPNLAAVFGSLGLFFDIIGSCLFVICFAIGLYIFIFFKWAAPGAALMLPPEDEFDSKLIPILWVIFAMKLIGNVILLCLQSGMNMFVVDWEVPKKEDIPVSAWRRIMVANQWNRILTVRCYNVPFTLLALVFMLQGFDLTLLATPIPSSSLIDMDKLYLVLEFAVISFLWLLLVFVEWIFTSFIYWKILGDPFVNFVDLCATSNISVLIKMSQFHGYYLHGKSVHASADPNMSQLQKQLKDEKNNLVPLRGLNPNAEHQVFETYFSITFRQAFFDLYNAMLAQTWSPSVVGCKQHLAGDIPKAAYAAYKELNEFLTRFFDKESEYKYMIQHDSCLQRTLGLIPTVLDDSILTVVKDDSFKSSLLAGIQGRLQFFYLVVFLCIESLTHQPCISAIVVYLIDVIVLKIYNTFGRANLSRKSLLDDRFFL